MDNLLASSRISNKVIVKYVLSKMSLLHRVVKITKTTFLYCFEAPGKKHSNQYQCPVQ